MQLQHRAPETVCLIRRAANSPLIIRVTKGETSQLTLHVKNEANYLTVRGPRAAAYAPWEKRQDRQEREKRAARALSTVSNYMSLPVGGTHPALYASLTFEPHLCLFAYLSCCQASWAC